MSASHDAIPMILKRAHQFKRYLLLQIVQSVAVDQSVAPFRVRVTRIRGLAVTDLHGNTTGEDGSNIISSIALCSCLLHLIRAFHLTKLFACEEKEEEEEEEVIVFTI